MSRPILCHPTSRLRILTLDRKQYAAFVQLRSLRRRKRIAIFTPAREVERRSWNKVRRLIVR